MKELETQCMIDDMRNRLYHILGNDKAKIELIMSHPFKYYCYKVRGNSMLGLGRVCFTMIEIGIILEAEISFERNDFELQELRLHEVTYH